eukprot:SRR837773.2305.p1 GENE.SRR837773.2305~~SRR837773.2305.p1  ORF type:complete len:213 (-),score=44.04 SRR837773.2305:179-817(-)
MIFNLDTCGFVNDDDCRLLKSYQIDGPMLNELVQALVVGDENNITDVGVAAADVMDKYKPIKEYVEFYAKIAAETFADHEAGSVVNLVEYQVLRQWSTNWFTPSATEENLVDACSAQVALLFVDAAPLQTADSFIDQPMNSTGSCNHAVYLVDCYPDNNVYTLWTGVLVSTSRRRCWLAQATTTLGISRAQCGHRTRPTRTASCAAPWSLTR